MANELDELSGSVNGATCDGGGCFGGVLKCRPEFDKIPYAKSELKSDGDNSGSRK